MDGEDKAKLKDETGPKKIVLFIDSLGPDDVESMMPITQEIAYDGKMDAGNPYVTPKVLGEIYTGKNPGEHGMPAVSRYNQDDRLRPAAPTLPEIVAEDDTYDNVLNFGLPFIVPPEVEPTGTYWHKSGAMGQQVTAPQDAQASLHIPGPAGDLSDPDEDGGLLWNHRRDYVRAQFEVARTLIDENDFDVAFISIRVPDSYVHYRYTEPEDAEFTDRELLLREVIDPEVEYLTTLGDIFVFGDHGGTELDNVFRINRWLMENGYLEVEVDEEKFQWAIEEGLMDDPDENQPGTTRTVSMPGVTVNEEDSVAVCDDPFSGGLTLLGGSTEENVEEMIEALEETDAVEEVEWSREMWDGDLIHEAPDLYPRRAVGTFISSNLADEMGGVEITRDGVHHPHGAFGATSELDAPDEVTPTELHNIILEGFLGIEDPSSPDEERDYDSGDDELAESRREHLRDMGYL